MRSARLAGTTDTIKPFHETFISLEGNIASGKSTILSALRDVIQEKGHNIPCIPEPVDDWVPILARFYKDQSRFAFATSIQVLFSYSDHSRFKGSVSERSPFSGRYVFATPQDNNGMEPEESAIYEQAYARLAWEPDIVFYVETPPEVCLERANSRARKCEAGLSLEYLKRIHAAHEQAFADNYKGRLLLAVDGTRPPKENAEAIFAILNTIGTLGDLLTTPPVGFQTYYSIQPPGQV